MTKNRPILALTLALALAGTSACVEEHEHDEGSEGEEAEMAEAAIAVEAARSTALSRVAGGEIVSGELEEEDGLLIYSFDIRVAGREGIEEVHVDARTGEVVAQDHETGEDEAAEAEEESEGSGR